MVLVVNVEKDILMLWFIIVGQKYMNMVLSVFGMDICDLNYNVLMIIMQNNQYY